MPAKIRVYELARELGLTNKETLGLTEALGIGVKSHSSSVVDAQADRVRRKAQREGLVRAEQPPEQEPPAQEPSAQEPSAQEPSAQETETEEATSAKKTATKQTPIKATPTKDTPIKETADETPAAQQAAPKSAGSPSVTADSTPAPDAQVGTQNPGSQTIASDASGDVATDDAEATAGATVVAESDGAGSEASVPATAKRVALKGNTPASATSTASATSPDATADLPATPDNGADASTGTTQRVISSAGSSARPKRSDDTTQDTTHETTSADAPVAKKTAVRKVVKKKVVSDPNGAQKTKPPASSSGKPIPPPPRSATGRSIPPPPSGRHQAPAGGRRFGGSHQRGRPQGGGPTSARSPRPGGVPTNRGAGGSRQAAPGAGTVPGGPGPGGGPGGRGGSSGPAGRGGPNQGRRAPRRKGGRRRRTREELQPMDAPHYTPEDAPVPKGEVVIERACTAQDLGPKLNRTAADVVHFLLQAGEMLTATHSLSDDMIELFAEDIGAKIRLVDPGEEQEVELQKLLNVGTELAETEADAPTRPPVVTVMGHVDHGKTLLLDRIRNANVVDGEAGGITQHIGAYQVEHDGKRLTFIDTPGHEAFTAMRARGAGSTDIVILMVAADDGVMPQTIEAINHAKAAEVPILVAVNKIDRDNADPQKAIAGVAEHGLVPEAWGGETIFQEISALEKLGIEELLDHLLLVAEVEDLRSSPHGRASGVVLEANLDIGRGPVATVLVQRGTLKVGDPLVAGAAWGRVRALLDDRGENVTEAGPSVPVQVLGLSDVASAGDDFVVAATEKVANRVASTRENWHRQASLGREAHALSGGARLEDIFTQIQRGEAATLNMVVKADVNGSLEAVTESLRKLERDEVKIRFVHRGVGGITENDIALAAASNATILGFNVRPDRKARELAESEKVEVRSYEIIYKLLEDIESAMVGMLAPEFEEVVTGEAEVREIFRVPRVGSVAGCYVQSGVITRGSAVRFLRDGTIIWKGEISSLKRFAEDAREVASGYECGIGLSNFQDLKQGDIIETFENREIERSHDA